MSDKKNLLLILIYRFIGDQALACESGELHSTFQQLSRFDGKYGTKTMYEWLGNSGVNTHVYSVRDDPDAVDDLELTVYDGTSDEYRHSWVVLFKPDTDDCKHVALISIETAPNVWRSMWTYEPDRVERIHEYTLKNSEESLTRSPCIQPAHESSILIVILFFKHTCMTAVVQQ